MSSSALQGVLTQDCCGLRVPLEANLGLTSNAGGEPEKPPTQDHRLFGLTFPDSLWLLLKESASSSAPEREISPLLGATKCNPQFQAAQQTVFNKGIYWDKGYPVRGSSFSPKELSSPFAPSLVHIALSTPKKYSAMPFQLSSFPKLLYFSQSPDSSGHELPL